MNQQTTATPTPAPAPTVSVVVPTQKEEKKVTQAEFNTMMDNWIAEQAKKDASDWSVEARTWAEKQGLISGDTDGKKMYKKMMTREELVMVLYRALHRYFI